MGAYEASRLIDAAGIKGLKELRDEVLRSFKGEKKDDGDKKKGKKASPKKKKSKRDRSRSRSRSPKGKRDRSPEGPPFETRLAGGGRVSRDFKNLCCENLYSTHDELSTVRSRLY